MVRAPSSTPGLLEMENLSFAYPNAPPVIRNFNLMVQQGERVAILGASGCGKSTVLSLIAGLAEAGEGVIRIGGVTLDDATADGLRGTIGWVSQKPFFFAASMKANIRFGRLAVSEAMVEEVLHRTGLDGLTQARRHLQIGDGGNGISGGEAVRLAIARAFADPATQLVLADEPTAHLDRETAALVTDNLLQLAKGRTLIVATHDPVLAARMDRIVDMTAIHSRGSHDRAFCHTETRHRPVLVDTARHAACGRGSGGHDCSGGHRSSRRVRLVHHRDGHCRLLPATAFAFDVFAPSAAIRLLALARTAARYGERMTTHEATLSVLAALREKLFRGFAAPQAAKSLEARPARLLNRLTADIDALDSLYLRVLVPAAVAILAALVTGFGLAFLHPLAGVLAATFLIAAGLGISARSALRAENSRAAWAIGLEALRARTADLVSGQTELLTTGRLSAQVAAVKRADDYLTACDDSLNRIETNAGFSFGLSAAILLSAALLGMAWLAEHGAVSAPAAALGLLVCFAALEPFTALRRGAMELGRTLFSARRIAPRLSATAEAHCPALPASGIAAELRGVRLEREGTSIRS